MEKATIGGFMEPFEAVGITPPRGRQGHSVPTPRPLVGSKLVVHVAGGTIQDREDGIVAPPSLEPPSFPPKMNLTQFSSAGRRDHFLGGSVSRLDRIRTRPQDLANAALPVMESFAEFDEVDGGEGGRGGIRGGGGGGGIRGIGGGGGRRGDNFTDGIPPETFPPPHYRLSSPPPPPHLHGNDPLDKFTGDSLLHFSYNSTGNFGGGDPSLGGSFVRAFTTNQGLLHNSLNIPSVHQVQGSEPAFSSSSTLFPTTARNPNKAIVTIDAQSSRVLMTNEITCELFGYQRDEIVGKKVQCLFTEPYRARQHALIERNIDSAGNEVLLSGKVMDAVTSYGVEFPVSVWMKKVSVSADSLRVIVVLEPVERTSARFSINHQGEVVSCDPWFASLFGYPNTPAVMGLSVLSLIPSLSLPHSVNQLSEIEEKQAVTGRTKDNTAFPLTVQFTDISQNLSLGDLYSPTSLPNTPPPLLATHTPSPLPPPLPCDHTHSINLPETPPLSKTNSEQSSSDYVIEIDTKTPQLLNDGIINQINEEPPLVSDDDNDDIIGTATGETPLSQHLPPTTSSGYVNAKVIVYAALSGMISFLPDGTIHGCNHHFSLMLTGYSQSELLKKDITVLMPEFYNHIGYVDDQGMPLPPLDDDVSFVSVADRSLSPDSAFDYLSASGRGHIPPSPLRRKNHEGQRSPVRKPNQVGQSPSHHHHPSPHPVAMPTLVEEEEEREVVSSLQRDDHIFSEDGVNTNPTGGNGVNYESRNSEDKVNLDTAVEGVKIHEMPTKALELNEIELKVEEEEEEKGRGKREMTGKSDKEEEEIVDHETDDTKSEERTREEEVEEEEEEDNKEPTSSTPAPRSHDPSLLIKSDSFSEYLRSAAAALVATESDHCSISSMVSLPEGLFEGFIQHKDGSSISVHFQLKCVRLAGDQSLFCMWLCRNLDRQRTTRNGDCRTEQDWTDQMGVSPDVTDDIDLASQPGLVAAHAVAGVYSTCYDTLRQLGTGAFGFVRLAQRKTDQAMVVVKFLRKSGVLQDSWVEDKEMGLVAREISILARLNHPNIVTLLEAYENDQYFQLVMEKHGDSLDLFEFIERCPRLTEPLISYMFRQVVAGLAYLHEKNILHRDIKDENIIINETFHLKLVDFGSAVFMEAGKVFHTFCGTIEYCSPEVLLGNSYRGPELEMWALGVTLYTLVFGENPFFDVEETISGHLQPPYLTSPGLMKLIFWLLHPDPTSRATLKDLQKDKWTNQKVDVSQFNFEAVLGFGASSRPHDDERTLQSPKPHPQNMAKPHPPNDKPHPFNDNSSIEQLFHTKLNLNSSAYV